jgi:hypothetical protein
MKRAALALAMAGALAFPAAARAATTENFQLRDTRDLVALCSPVPGSELYVAAINFCHGFGVGAFQYYQALEGSVPGHKFICPPDPRPSRSAVVEGFVTWANANPSYLGEPAVDSLFRYLSTTYACPQ